MNQRAPAATDHSGAIWVIGIALVIAVAATSPYWQGVFIAVTTGQAPKAAGGASASGSALTLATILLVVILAALAGASEAMGAFGLVFLLVLWGWFILSHAQGVSGFFKFFSPR